MKKRFLTLVAAALLLAGCGEEPAPGPGPGPGPGPSSDIPTEEGKTTFYFTMGDGSVAIPEYCSAFVTGGFNNWAEACDKAVELKKLEGKDNIYYAMVDALDAEGKDAKFFEYQLTVGYNAASGAAQTGVNWSYKSAECKAASGESGTENKSFEIVDGVVDLGTHTWEAVPGPVKTAKNLTFEVNFAEAVPENVAISMAGNFKNNWVTQVKADDPKYDTWEEVWADNLMTPSADRKTFTMVMPEINGGTYEAVIMADYADAKAYSWSAKLSGDANAQLMILTSGDWAEDYVYNLNDDLFEGEALEYDFATNFPVAGAPVAVTLEVEFDAAITLEKLYVKGNFDGWGDGVVMTSEDTINWTAALGEIAGGTEVEFGVLGDADWHRALKVNGNNIKAAIGNEATTIKITAQAGAAAIINEDASAQTDWVNADVATIEDANGVHDYINYIKKGYETASIGDMVTVYGVITAGYAGTYDGTLYNANNGLFIADGDYSIMLYRVPGNIIPEGAVVGETVVKAYAKVALYKGLIQLTYDKVEGATLEIVSEPSRAFVSNEVTLDAMPSKMTDLSRQAKITGEVTKVSGTIDGASDITVEVKVSDSFTMKVFLKKQAGWDYAALATTLAVGNKVEVKGFIAIYDNNADGSAAKYASSTGWQIVNPTSAVVVAE